MVVLARRLPTKRDLGSNQLGVELTQIGIAKLGAIQEVGTGTDTGALELTWC